MRTLLLAASPPPSDPAAPSLIAAARERLPPGWDATPAPSAAAGWRRLGRASAVAFLGSDGICGPVPGRAASALALTIAAQARACRVALLGVRAAPAEDRLGRLLLRALIARADLLVLADEPSAQALVAAGTPAPLRVATDPAWAAMAAPAPPVERRDAAVVAVGRGGYGRDTIEPLRGLAASGLELALQPWERHAGAATHAASALADALGPGVVVLEPVSDLDAARRRFAAARLVVGGPPRALMAAAAAETPFVAATPGSSAAQVARAQAQLVATDGDLPRALAVALRAEPPSRAAVEAEIAAAEASYRLLRLLLSEGEEAAEDVGAATRLAPEVWNA